MKNNQRPSPSGGTGRGLPLVGRFLSPDNYVQLPDFTQNFNRYSYALNNPLKYNDPSGEIIFTILAAIFAPPLIPLGITMDLAGGLNAWNHRGVIKEGWQENKWKSFGKVLSYYGIGGGQVAANYYLGPLGSIAGTYGGEALNALVNDGKITKGEYDARKITTKAIINLGTTGLGVGDKIGTGATKWIGNELVKNISKNLIQQNFDEIFSSVIYESWRANDLKNGFKRGWNSYTSGGWFNASISSLGQGVMDTYDTRTISRNQQIEQMKMYHKTHKTLSGFNGYNMNSMSFTNKIYYFQIRTGMGIRLSIGKHIYNMPKYFWGDDLLYPEY